jgi:MFS family permease
MIALYFQIQFLLYVCCLFVGLGQGLGQFYRFSAIEVAPDHFKARAVTFVLSGGVVAAILGPLFGEVTIYTLSPDYFLSFAVMLGLGLVNQITISLVRFPPLIQSISESENKYKEIPLDNLLLKKPIQYNQSVIEICKRPSFYISCIVSTFAHTIMVILMGCVTLAMKKNGYDSLITTIVLSLHFLSMFGPGFITGYLLTFFGPLIVAFSGGILYLISLSILASGETEVNFFLGMVFLGIGWNFSFSAGTLMLSSSYKVR